jgi:hypothetical protein
LSDRARLAARVYRVLLAFYPAEFRAEFGEEMQDVFATALRNGERPWRLFWREVRDWPGAIGRAYLETKKGNRTMENGSNSSTSRARSETLITLALFVLPAVPAILKFIFGYQAVINSIGSGLTIGLLVFVAVVLVLGVLKGVPRWSVPFLGVAVMALAMLELSWRIWGLFYQSVQSAIGYYTDTLQVHVLYSTLMVGFFWLTAFVAVVTLVTLLAIWPRTRRLAQTIRRDWTLLSFMLYSGVVFALLLVFEEYRYDEPWKIACWASLALGAWAYLRSGSSGKRILALLVGVTLAYWIAAIGKWYLVPLQSWETWFRWVDPETYRWFESWRTLAEWGWAILFMLAPSLLTLLPRVPETGVVPVENRLGA